MFLPEQKNSCIYLRRLGFDILSLEKTIRKLIMAKPISYICIKQSNLKIMTRKSLIQNFCYHIIW